MNPSVGMLATIRNRRGIVSAVDPFDGPDGRLHLVTIEYADADGNVSDQLVWEREPGASLVEPGALPNVGGHEPMAAADFDALVRATRWSAIQPFLDPDGTEGPLQAFPVSSPLHSAIQIDDFQLVPLLKALRMPRVTLMLADDVGLGKTVEAGLILSELLIRRRVRRVLVLCPASLRSQWRQEMHDKFSLSFDDVDREATHRLRKELGMDANPWRTFPRIIASYHYLRQPDVLEEFRSASRMPEGSPRLPWDLLVVDEAHNLSPAPFGEDSDLSRMLGHLAPLFEHRLFLTATPHNGHTRSFTGLLERLDPVRFTQSSKLEGAMKARVEDVVIRRLKREINAVTRPPRFSERHPQAVTVKLSPAEVALSAAFEAFRAKVRELVTSRRRGDELAGAFAVEVLRKRLLSGPVAFADSWHRYLEGAREDDVADASEVRAAERAVREDTDDDREAEGRAVHAVRTVGAWLKPLADELAPVVAALGDTLTKLGLGEAGVPAARRRPKADCRCEALIQLIEERLRADGRFRDDERLIVFTEYKTTLDYLEGRLKQIFPEEGVIRVLFGGPEFTERDAITAAFNDPADPVRVLLATDAASEGLNLQETARFVLHWDVPWNPSRLEQRNGRLDRHGQARDVTAFHFASDDDADLRFIARVVEKIDTIRDDLGSFGEVFDVAFRRRFIDGVAPAVVEKDLNLGVESARGRAEVPRDDAVSTGHGNAGGEEEAKRIDALRVELDLSPTTLRDTLETALAIGVGRPRLDPPDSRGRVRLHDPIPGRWASLVDDSLRVGTAGKSKGALPWLVFDPGYFVKEIAGRPVFRPVRDTALLHLAHPLYHRALAAFARLRFPGADVELKATRWLVRRGPVPKGADAVILMTLEELAVNELRETFHHWLRTLQLPIKDGDLAAPLAHVPAGRIAASRPVTSNVELRAARDLWEEVDHDVKAVVKAREQELTHEVEKALALALAAAQRDERERFTSRQREIAALMGEQSIAKLEREIERIETELKQQVLFDPEGRVQKLRRSREELDEELKRRTTHLSELKEQLDRERTRILDHLLPRRFKLRGDARCFPVTIEIRLPEVG